MNAIFNNLYTRWSELESAIEQLSSPKERGDVFEEFVWFYFERHKTTYQIKEHYCPVAQKKPFPKSIKDALKLEDKDHGVDGVYVKTDGKVVAYQCKFRSHRASLTFTELSTFWSEAEYADFRCTVTNSSAIPSVSDKKMGHIAVLPSQFDQLPSDFFADLHKFATTARVSTKIKKAPRDYQKEILQDLSAGLDQNNRGKFIAACGIGKTLISLWLVEAKEPDTVLFLAPSLQLIRQTLGEWAAESAAPFDYICVCSDNTVALEEDENNLSMSEMDVPVTTDADAIGAFLSQKSPRRRVIFSTYQSVPVLAEGINKSNFAGFDLAICDEAHRTASGGGSTLFSLALSDDHIPCSKRLFMTATERVVKPHLKEAAEKADDIVFSMDDESLYGPVLYKLSFGEAISRGIISDYRLVFAGTHSDEVGNLVAQNKYVTSETDDLKTAELAQLVYRRLLLVRCVEDLGCQKTITFHSKVSDAQVFANAIVKDLGGNATVHHVNGSMSSSQRTELISDFEQAERGILTNVRCLTEGVDIPLIDSVFFANPRGSLIDIVQAVGRALRQPYGAQGKIAYIIVPILLDEAEGSSLIGPGFDTLFNVIQALRDQDESLAEWIDSINLGAVTGRSISTGGGKLKLILPPEIDFTNLSSALLLKIADVNKNASDHISIGSQLGKTERKSSYTRIFKTLCDYRADVLKSNLVDPTLDRMVDATVEYNRTDIKIDNNNVSHCVRLGVIEEVEKKKYRLTPLGVAYRDSQVNFTDLFKNQMLKYADAATSNRLFPYRVAFKFMHEVKALGFRDFIYTLYSTQLDESGQPNLAEIVGRARTIQEQFPNTAVASEANKQNLLAQLNELHPVGFTYNDVWTDRTTTGNQFRYFLRHLELFGDIFQFNAPSNRLILIAGQEAKLEEYLTRSASALDATSYTETWWLT